MAVLNKIALLFLIFVMADFLSFHGTSADTSASQNLRSFRKKVGSKNRIKEDQALLNTPFSKLSASLRVAPVCLTILGSLNLIATKTDINLMENTGSLAVDFEHLAYPDSLRASLAQLGDAAYWAFFEANDAMHDIELRSERVPGYLGTALKLLFTGLDIEIKSQFPIKMAQIKEVALQCRDRSQGVADRYKKVLLIAQDLNKASLRKQGYTKDELADAELQAKIEEEKAEQTRIRLERTQERVEEWKELFQNRSEAFQKAKDNMEPNEWVAFGMGMLQSLPSMLGTIGGELLEKELKNGTGLAKQIGASITKSLSDGLTGGFKKMQQKLKSFTEQGTSVQANPEPEKKVSEKKKVSFATRTVVGEIKKMQLEIFTGLDKFFFKNGTLDVKKLNPSSKGLSSKEIKGRLVASDRAIKKQISKGADKQLADKAITLIRKVVKLVKDLESALTNKKAKPGTLGKSDHNKFLQYKTSLNSIINSDIPLITGEPAFKKVGPDDPKVDSNNYRQELKNAHLQLKIAEEQLNSAEKKKNELEEKEQELMATIQEAMVNLKKFNLTADNLAEQLSVLTKGIQAVAHLEKEWSTLVVYFQDFATRVDALLSTPLEAFVKQAEANYEDGLYKIAAAKVSKKTLFDLAYSTSVDAYKINKEAAAYYELSDKHFMPAVATLKEILALDPENDKQKILRKQKEINRQGDEMVYEIDQALKKKAEEFREKIESRKVELKLIFDTEVIKKLPEKIQQENKEIEKEAEETFEESKQTIIDCDEYC